MNTKFYIVIGFLLVLFIYLNKKVTVIKGKMGESAVKILLKKLDKKDYIVINDLILKNDLASSGTSQIDHIVISKYGIFCIETKNYRGQIYGSERQRRWTQNIYGNKKSFINSIFQNYGHVKIIENIISEKGYENIPVTSIIAFDKGADLKIKLDKSIVIKIPYIVDTIIKLSNDKILNDIQIKELEELIKDKILKDTYTKKHVNNIKKSKKEKRGGCKG